MVGKVDYSSVPSADLENNSSQKKYTVNRGSSGDISISRPVCALFVMGALLLAAVAAVITYFLVPGCDGNSLPESLTRSTQRILNDPTATDELTSKYVRLPRTLEPTHYRLYILPKLQTDFTTSGNITIKLKVNSKTNEIRLNAVDLNINEHSVSLRRVKDSKPINIGKQAYVKNSEIYSINLKEFIMNGEEYELFIEFTGSLNDYMVGFYRSYDQDSNTTRWMATTQFSPTYARKAFPCFDEPAFKAKFTISVARALNMSTLSNMPKKDQTVIHNDSLIWDNYQETPIMSTYLVAFIVHNFVPYSNQNRNFTIWTRESRRGQARYALDIGPPMLEYLEGYFDIKYPLPKLDIVALPDFVFSAMENWGLTTFREKMLLTDRASSTVANYRSILYVLGHELSHNWFGNLVTPKFWDNVWLKEGFSTYFAYLAANNTKPEWHIIDEFFYGETSRAFLVDNLISSKPLHHNLETSEEIRHIFNEIAYSKGASLVKMIANILGEQSFQKGMRAFLKTHQYSNVNNDDLWKILMQQGRNDSILSANTSMKDIMNGWITQAGYPVVSVVADYKNNTLKLTQKRFLSYGKTTSNDKWWIPISYTTGDNPSYENGMPKVWMNEAQVSLNLNLSMWYLLNLKQGYYIVNYDEKNWQILTENIMLLPPVIRAQLVGDSMDLAKAGLLDYSIPLSMITNIGLQDKQIMYVPLLSIFRNTDYLFNILYNTPAFGIYDKYFRYIFYFALKYIDFVENPDDPYLTQSIRVLVLKQACRQPHMTCALEARRMYRTWMERGYSISPNIRSVVYCTAIRDGDEDEWNFAYKQYLQSQIASEKGTLLSALGCSSKHWMLAKLLDMMITNSSGIRRQDGAMVFDSVAANIYGHNIAFDFLRNRWKEINEYYGESIKSVANMISSIDTFMNSEVHLKQLEAFMEDNIYDLKGTKQEFVNTIERVKSKIEWMKNNYKSVESWLQERVSYFRI